MMLHLKERKNFSTFLGKMENLTQFVGMKRKREEDQSHSQANKK